MIIDTHTHFYDPDRPGGVPWPPPENELLYRTVLPRHFQEVAEPEGVTGTVVVEASKRLADNQWVLDLAADNRVIVGLVGHIAPNRPQFAEELAAYAGHPLFRGIRCGGGFFEEVEDGSLLADMALLAQRNLSLDVLAQPSHLDGVVAVAEHTPALRIVINHVAHIPIDGQPISDEWVARYRRLAAQPNVAMKVSGLLENSTVQPAPEDPDFYRPLLDVLWDVFGEERLLYGSNWPVCERSGSYRQAIGVVRAYFTEKGSRAADRYFQANAREIYRWVDRRGESSQN